MQKKKENETGQVSHPNAQLLSTHVHIDLGGVVCHVCYTETMTETVGNDAHLHRNLLLLCIRE